MKNWNFESRIPKFLKGLGLCILACAILVPVPAWGQESDDPDYFYAELGAVLWDVDGQEEKFKELNQVDDGLTGGIEALGYDRDLGGDWLLHFTGRLVAERDADASVVLNQSDRWKFDVGYRTFRSYENNAVESYDFGSGTNQLSRSMELDRGWTHVRAKLNQPGLPAINIGYEYRSQDGRRLLLERGQVDFFSFRNLPQFKDTDTEEHAADLHISHTLAGFDLSFNQALNFFDGSIISSSDEFETGVGTSRTEERNELPDYFLSTSSLEVSRNIKDKLFLSLGYRFQKTDGESDFNKTVAASPGEPSDIKGSSDVTLDKHSVSLGIRYLPLEYLTLIGEMGYENLKKDATADNLFLLPSDVLVVSEKNKSNVEDKGLEGNLEIQFSAIPRTTLDAGAEYSRIDRNYDESFSSDRGILDSFILDSDADLTNTGYWVRVRIRPFSFVHLSARYGWDRLLVDFDDDPVWGRGPVPGINDRSRTRGRTEVQVRLTPLPILSAILTYRDDRSKFFTFSNEPDEIANGHVRSYGAGLIFVPWSRITLSTQYTYQDYWANTTARSSPENVPYDSQVHTWFAGMEIAVREGTRLLLNSQISSTDGEGQNAGGDGSLGSMSLDSLLQSYGIALEHALTKRMAVRAAFEYMDLDAEENYDHDDFQAYMFFLRLRIEMP